jgi:hypothetical protein
MVLYNVLFDVDQAIKTSAQKAVGWSGDMSYQTAKSRSMPANCDACHSANDGTNYVHATTNLTTTNCDACHAPVELSNAGSAIDQINVMQVVTPDLVNSEWVNAMYSPIAGMVLTLFSTLLLVAVIAHLWGMIIDEYPTNQGMILLVKRCIIEIPAIYFGIEIFALMLLGNSMVSTMFAGTVSVGTLCMVGLMEPSGLIVLAYAIGTALTAWFYICRYFIVIVTLMLWPIGCILRIFELTRAPGIMIFRITLINIFLGSWMCICYAAGAWVTTAGPNGVFVSWGASVVGVVVMFGALALPRALWKSEIGYGFLRSGRKAVTYVKMVV